MNAHMRQSKRIRRRWFSLLLLAIIVTVAIFHRTLLQGVAELLIVDQTPPTVDAVVILGGDGRHPVAAIMLEGGTANSILLIEPPPTRLTELGIIEKRSEAARRKLVELGVAQDRIVVVQGNPEQDPRAFRILSDWLGQHPNTKVAVLCDRFGSRWVRYTLDNVLDERDRRRVHVVALRDRRYDESNWWSRRTGWKVVFNAYFDLAYAVCCGEDEAQPPMLDADEFEREVVQRWNSQKE